MPEHSCLGLTLKLQMELAIANRAGDTHRRSQGAQGGMDGGFAPVAASEHAVFARNRSGSYSMQLASMPSAVGYSAGLQSITLSAQ